MQNGKKIELVLLILVVVTGRDARNKRETLPNQVVVNHNKFKGDLEAWLNGLVERFCVL